MTATQVDSQSVRPPTVQASNIHLKRSAIVGQVECEIMPAELAQQYADSLDPSG